MLSIIISSYQPDYYNTLEKNIAETCGIGYEIIRIENYGKMGICEAYNKGAARAKHPYLLFLHEDIIFESKDWGKELLFLLSQDKTGVIGVAGATYIPSTPFAWWDLHTDNYRNLNQYNGNQLIRSYRQPEDQKVKVLDGVFIGCRKKLWQAFLFNEHLSGFHAYDIDFTARVAGHYTNIVSSKIILNHYSEGKMDKTWFTAVMKARGFFQAPADQKIDKKKELYFYERLKFHLIQLNYDEKVKNKILRQYNNPKYIGYKAFLKNIIRWNQSP